MGDISAEPSMEEILSSIKRIIAEEGEAPGRPRRPVRERTPMPDPVHDSLDDDDEILELSDPMPSRPVARQPEPARQPERVPDAVAETRVEPVRAPEPTPEPAAEPIVSRKVAEGARGSLEALTRMMVKPEPGTDGTLEGLVREMLRPMLRDWLDANLPDMVETMVAREIERITRQP